MDQQFVAPTVAQLYKQDTTKQVHCRHTWILQSKFSYILIVIGYNILEAGNQNYFKAKAAAQFPVENMTEDNACNIFTASIGK